MPRWPDKKEIKIQGRKIRQMEVGKEAMTLGLKTLSVNVRHCEMTVVPEGVHIFSKATSLEKLIPWANIKAFEFLPEEVKPE